MQWERFWSAHELSQIARTIQSKANVTWF